MRINSKIQTLCFHSALGGVYLEVHIRLVQHNKRADLVTERKVEFETILETQKNTEEQFHVFQKQIALFAQLDIDDQHVLKQLLIEEIFGCSVRMAPAKHPRLAYWRVLRGWMAAR